MMTTSDKNMSDKMMTSEKDESSDLLVNNLIYVSPDPLSLAVNRTQTRMFPQRSQYVAGETLRCDFNSGSLYVDPVNSYLVFDIKLEGTAGFVANWGVGSAMNLIRQVTLRSKSGTEIDRVENANIFSRFKTVNTESKAYLRTTGAVEGWDVTALETGTVVDSPLGADYAIKYALPLKRLSGFFSPVKQGQLIPAAIFSGLTIELIFEDVRTAIVAPTQVGSCTGYTLTNVSFMVDGVELTDDTQKTLNSLSSSSGLECTYERVYTSINDLSSAQNTLSAQVRKAVSNSLYAFAVSLNPANIRNISADSFKSQPNKCSNYQWRLGSLFYPNQPLSDPALTGVEPFLAKEMTFNKLRNEHQEPAVSLDRYRVYEAVICASFERSQLLNVSGQPTNNSRVLELDCTFQDPDARQVYVFMVYNCVSRSYLDNTSVGF
jgi:hypothetical protein